MLAVFWHREFAWRICVQVRWPIPAREGLFIDFLLEGH
jgi:hypothetical protein